MEFLSQLHPRIVHFPIAFFFLYFFLESAGIILKKDFLLKAAFLVLIIGIITALISVLTGNQAMATAKLLVSSSEVNQLLELHEEYATVTLFYFTGILILRAYLVLKKKFVGNLRYIFILLGLIGCYLIYTTGIHGGDLVFKYGVGTHYFGK